MTDFREILADPLRLARALQAMQLSAKVKADMELLYDAKRGIPVDRDTTQRLRGPSVNSCSKVGVNLSRHLGGVGPRDKMMWVGEIKKDTKENEIWVMRKEMRTALQAAGIIAHDNETKLQSTQKPIDVEPLPVVNTALVTPRALAGALAALRPKMTEAQFDLLRKHFSAPNYAIQVDGQGRTSPVVSHYGRLGGAISRVLGKRPKDYHHYWLAVVKPARGRTPAAWHLRPNLAAALELLGWFSPPEPDKKTNNSADKVESQEQVFSELEDQVAQSLAGARSLRLARLKRAPTKPETIVVLTAQFRRNPDVVAEALYRAKGKCEECLAPAPFTSKVSGRPYLEVHHVVPLSKGGDDTVKNAVALCPNCHRGRHYG
jgi:predicted HNH restriction endonuclease